MAELGSRQPVPRGRAHRVRQVIEQAMQVLAETVDRLALQPEARVAEEDDGANTHRGSISTAASAQLGAPGFGGSGWIGSPACGSDAGGSEAGGSGMVSLVAGPVDPLLEARTPAAQLRDRSASL